MRMRLAGVLLALTLAGGVLAGCGGSDNARTSCDLSACTVTFTRGVEASVSILGAELQFVGVDNDQVKVKLAGQEVSVPLQQQTEVGGLKLTVENVTASEVVVKVAR